MTKLIIDTDTGSDDAVALVMALRDPDVEVLVFTTVSGNVVMEQATVNCLQSIEYAATYAPPVYKGCEKPMLIELETADQVHGADGMGDCEWFKKPTLLPESEHAVDAMLRLIREGGGDVEILALGPLTNLAAAIMQEPETMRRVPHITIMGGAHPYHNPHTVTAEFNVMADPESADVVFSFGVPFTLVTLEACWGDMRFEEDDLARMSSAGETGSFCKDCNRTMTELAREMYGAGSMDLPDPAAFAAITRKGLIRTSFEAYTRVELKGEHTRGATIFMNDRAPNSLVVTELDGPAFKDYLYELLTRG